MDRSCQVLLTGLSDYEVHFLMWFADSLVKQYEVDGNQCPSFKVAYRAAAREFNLAFIDGADDYDGGEV